MGLFGGKSRSQKQADKMRSFSDIKGAEAEKYVKSHGDLLAAYNQIKTNPAGVQGSYWLQKMGGQMSMAAFGEAHRGEDKLLFEGKYAGGTKVKKEYNVNSFISGGALFLSIFSSRRMLYVFQSFFGFHQRL